MPVLGRRLTSFGQALLALIIDLRWSNATLTLILNETDEIRRNELLTTWVNHRFADLERINLTVSLTVKHLGLSKFGANNADRAF